MKVKCTKFMDASGRDAEHSPWLALDSIYHVMGINIGSSGQRSYHIVATEKPSEWPSIGYFDSRGFEVLSDIVPSNWRLSLRQNSITIGPASWLVDGFLESFHDHDPSTLPVFQQERAIILAEDP